MVRICMFISVLLLTCCDRNAHTNKNEILLAYGDNNKINTENVKVDLTGIDGAYLLLSMSKYDFGKIQKSKNPYITIEFEVKNIGKKPLLITRTDVSCGCLSTEYSKKPISPNKKTKLRVSVDFRSLNGVFNKTVCIKSNAENDVVLLRLVGYVSK